MARNALSLVFQIILFLAFMFFGIVKFIVSPADAARVFGHFGGEVAQYFTGIYQIIAAVLKLIPTTAEVGAILIMICMVVAFLVHLFIVGFAGPMLIVSLLAVLFFVMALYVFRVTRPYLFR